VVSATDDSSLPAGGEDQLDPGERAELHRLRAEVSELRSKRTARRRHVGWRTPVASLLIVLGCLLAPLAVVGVWTANQVSDTGRYVQNMAPLASDPAIQNALTDKISNRISTEINVTSYADLAADQLASRGLTRASVALRSFAPQIASAVAGFIHAQVHKIVTSQAFASLWVRLNTVAHAQLVKALSGQGNSAISVQNGQVTLSLGPFIKEAEQRLAARGLTIVTKLPPINPTFPLFSAKYLVKAQTGYRLLNDLKIVLPLAAVLLLAVGVYVAKDHRRALIGAGLGLATAMFGLAAGLLIVRGVYLNSVPNSKLPADAAAALFDTLVRFIKAGLRTLLVLGLVVAAAAFLTGPSVTAVRARQATSAGLRWLGDRAALVGVRSGPVGRWTCAHRKALRIGVVALAVVIFVFWGKPTAVVVIVLALLLLLMLGLIELIGRPVQEPPAAEPPTAANTS
jgi:hypothetical protein